MNDTLAEETGEPPGPGGVRRQDSGPLGHRAR